MRRTGMIASTMEAPPAQYVRTKDGYDLAYCDVGAGRPVVLLPSRLNSMAYTWYRWAPWFAPLREDNRFVSFDARGQGLSTRGLREDVAIEDYVSDLALVLDQLNLSGQSWSRTDSAAMSPCATPRSTRSESRRWRSFRSR